MSLCSLLLAVCLLWARVALGYEDDYEVTYDDSYYNEIPGGDRRGEAEPTPPPCQVEERSRWDKLFIMLEDSQMRQNMLLHSLDTVVGAQLKALASDLRRVVVPMDAVGNRLETRLGKRADEAIERWAVRGGRVKRSNPMEDEEAEGNKKVPERDLDMQRRRRENPKRGIPSETIATALQTVQAQLDALQRFANQHFLPSGCDTALLFPWRSALLHVAVRPDVSMALQTLTLCLWAKPAQVVNRTVLFSYTSKVGSKALQLSLSGGKAVFAVGWLSPLEGGETRGGQWAHYCATWSSEEGNVTLWVDGKLVASTSGVAKGRTIPDDGNIHLGQEWTGTYNRFRPVFDPKEAFVGRMTGVNLWNRVLRPEEIAQYAQLDGTCGYTGNVVGWATSETTVKEGAQFIH